MKREEEKKRKRIELPNLETIRTLGEKRKLQLPWNLGSRHHQTNRDERKSKNKSTLEKQENFSKPSSATKMKEKIFLGSPPCNILRDIDTRLTKAWTAINRLSII